jgi:hypothetical protein
MIPQAFQSWQGTTRAYLPERLSDVTEDQPALGRQQFEEFALRLWATDVAQRPDDVRS